MKDIALKALKQNIRDIKQVKRDLLVNDVGSMNEEENFYVGHASDEEELDIRITVNHLSIAENMIRKILSKYMDIS